MLSQTRFASIMSAMSTAGINRAANLANGNCGNGRIGTLKVARGTVQIRRAGKWQRKRKGFVVERKDRMRTDARAQAYVESCDKSSQYLNHSTQVTLVSRDETEVTQGEVRQLVPAGKEHQLRTPVADAFGSDVDVRVQSNGQSVFVAVSGIAQVENSLGSVVLHPDQKTSVKKDQAPSKPSHVDAAKLVSWTSSLAPPTPTATATAIPTRDSQVEQFAADPSLSSISGWVTSSQVFPDPTSTAQCFIQVTVKGPEPAKFGDCVGYGLTITCGGTTFDATSHLPDHGAAIAINGIGAWTGLYDLGSSCTTVPGVSATLSAQVSGLTPGQHIVEFWNNDDSGSARSGCVSYVDAGGTATKRCITNTSSGNNGTYYETTADAATGTVYETADTLKGNVTLGGVFILPLPGVPSPTPTNTAIPASLPTPTLTSPAPPPPPTVTPTSTLTSTPITFPTGRPTATEQPTATATAILKPSPTPTRNPNATPTPSPTFTPCPPAVCG